MFDNIQKAIILGAGILAGGFFQSASADWGVDAGGISENNPQDIVITLKSNPITNPEAACLAVTFSRMLSGNSKYNVTLFVTLDGVNLGDKHSVVFEDTPFFECATPSGVISLKDNLEAFLNVKKDDSMVVCPICWKERYGAEHTPGYGVLPGKTPGVPGTAIGTMIGNADKILDF